MKTTRHFDERSKQRLKGKLTTKQKLTIVNQIKKGRLILYSENKKLKIRVYKLRLRNLLIRVVYNFEEDKLITVVRY